MRKIIAVLLAALGGVLLPGLAWARPQTTCVVPTAKFTVSTRTGVQPTPVTFIDTSDGGPFTVSKWDFGDNTSYKLTDGTTDFWHTYTAPGSYTVTHTVKNACGTSIKTKADWVVVSAWDASMRTSGPTRVLLVGDSITCQYRFDAENEFVAEGDSAADLCVGGTGPLDRDIRTGYALADKINTFQPDVVVFEYTGNYQSNTTYPAYDPAITIDTPEFFQAWHDAAAFLTSVAQIRGAKVSWVSNAQAIPGTWFGVAYNPRIPQINAEYQTLAGVGLVDEWTPFGGATPDPTLRNVDGLHLADPAGFQLYAETTVQAVNAQVGG